MLEKSSSKILHPDLTGDNKQDINVTVIIPSKHLAEGKSLKQMHDVSIVVSGKIKTLPIVDNEKKDLLDLDILTQQDIESNTVTFSIESCITNGTIIGDLGNILFNDDLTNQFIVNVPYDIRKVCLDALTQLYNNIIQYGDEIEGINFLGLSDEINQIQSNIGNIECRLQNKGCNASNIHKYVKLISDNQQKWDLYYKNNFNNIQELPNKVSNLLNKEDLSPNLKEYLHEILSQIEHINNLIISLPNELQNQNNQIAQKADEITNELLEKINKLVKENTLLSLDLILKFIELNNGDSIIEKDNNIQKLLPVYDNLEILSKHKLLTNENLLALLNSLSSQSDERQLQLQHYINALKYLDGHGKVKADIIVPMVIQANFDAMLKPDSTFSLSCVSRIGKKDEGGLGVEDGLNTTKQERWGYWCRATEKWFSNQFANGKSLYALLDDLASIRNHIAKQQETDNKEDFGKKRDEYFKGVDTYGSDPTRSVVNTKLWPSIQEIVTKLYEEHESEFKDDTYSLKRQVTIFKDTPCKSKIFITKITDDFSIAQKFVIFLANNDVKSVASEFAAPMREKKFDKAIEYVLNEVESKIRENYNDKEIFLEVIGKFAYDFARLYPFKRGTGAIGGIMIRGLVDTYFNHEIGDVSIGGKNREISYDVYAHFIQNNHVDKYVNDFKKTLLPLVRDPKESTMQLKQETNFKPT